MYKIQVLTDGSLYARIVLSIPKHIWYLIPQSVSLVGF